MRRPGLGILTLLAALALVSVSRAAEVVVANDSTVNGVPSTPGNFFLAGEETAAWLTSPCNGDVVAAQVYWTSNFGGNPPSLETDITLYAGGPFPTPGSILINQGGGNAVVLGPVLSDTAMNEFRFLDPPADTQPLQVPVTQGQTFVVSLEFANQSSGNPFASGPGLDTDGCQNGLNAGNIQPGGWTDLCLAALPGDLVIRAVVDCTAPEVPAASPTGLVLLAAALLGTAGLLVCRHAGALPWR